MKNEIIADAKGKDWALYFGGPTAAPLRLRDVLAAKIDEQGAGDEIIWATYYFCDLDLAERLMRAQERGVVVRLVLQEKPRFKSANQPVINLLKSHPIWDGVSLYNPKGKLSGNLHSKIYVFKGAVNSAFIGSFNPSGDGAGDAALIAEIGNQDRGYNLLLELFDENLVSDLARHVADIGARNGQFWRRLNGPVFASASGQITNFPQLRPLRRLKGPIWPKGLSRQSCLRIAASHVKGRLLTHLMRGAFRTECEVKLLTHHTERRAPEDTLNRFRSAGVDVRRYQSPDNYPMHAKFILSESKAAGKHVRLGSLNYNQKSLWLNDELIFDSDDAVLHDALSHWFDQIWAEAA